ncbi:MAG TPA: DUF441 domain-containing protein [Bacillota bacterium]
MPSGAWVLLLVLAAGIVGRNPLVIAAAAGLLFTTFVPIPGLLPLMERYSINVGLTLLIVGLLVPFATGRLGLADMITGLRGPLGMISLLGGALAAYMCGKGLELLEVEPEIIVGLVAGTIIGVGLLRGIPVGPLAAAGLTAVMYEMWRLWTLR